MGKSFEEIDYRLRPSKNIERKMMTDMLGRLTHIRPLRDYRYIGFGSTYFSDHRLFHKELGINNMISIEQVFQDEERFRFNKPYDCIEIRIGKSRDELPELDWDVPTILWLDYEEKLMPYMFKDIEQFASSAPVGSVLFVTVNAQPTPRGHLDDEEDRLDRLKTEIGSENIPHGITKRDLRKWGTARVYRDIINQKIETDYLYPRNQGVPDDEQLEFRQLVNFHYQDNAKMLTVGGILYSDHIKEEYNNASFEQMEFVRSGEEEYTIKTPKLTFAEMRSLDKLLPKPLPDNEIPVPEEDKEAYAELYRYFPRFSETEI